MTTSEEIVNMLTRVSLLLTFLTSLAGCGAPGAGVGVSSHGWSFSDSDKPMIPGIDEAQVTFGTVGEEPVITFWSDCQCNFSGSGTGNSKTQFIANFETDSGKSFKGTMEITKDQKSVIQIAGKKFDSSQGTTFLISTRDSDTPRIQQLNLAIPHIHPKPPNTPLSAQSPVPDSPDISQQLREFAAKTPEISEFFGR
ncbi:MAG: hypothetical protein JNL58_11420 [Planctomyces sp.]|nr:hypothetical protein [Planctomyces sp.]